MQLPKIDLSSLPGLDTVQGLFGSLSDLANATVDDRIVVLMVYIYETLPPGTRRAVFRGSLQRQSQQTPCARFVRVDLRGGAKRLDSLSIVFGQALPQGDEPAVDKVIDPA